MPRGRKPQFRPYQEQLAILEEQIEMHQKAIAELKVRKKDLLAAKEKEEMTRLYQAVKASGKTPEELLEALNTVQENPEQ